MTQRTALADRLMLCVALLCAAAPRVAAQEARPATSTVFSRYAEHVVKIEVVERGSGAKATLGTGFFVTDSGHLVSNYHVISSLVHDPDRYRAELVTHAGDRITLQLLAVDVVHDLAVLKADMRPAAHFELDAVDVRQGERLYALGHPSDLGLSIVEGTFNGHLQHTLYPKIHFTGSINQGMSGGPTITSDGRVVGINVSTAGNQLSFLVPVERAAALTHAAIAPDYVPTDDLLAGITSQLRDYQDIYLEGMFDEGSAMVDLGGFQVVTQPAEYFRCWGDADRTSDVPYEVVYHQCSTDDYVYITDDQRSGVIRVSHQLISTTRLAPTRFFAIYTSVFQRDETPAGTEEHVTSWHCSTRNVHNGSVPVRAALCVRAYRKLAGLYDAVLRVAILGHRDRGLVSTMTLSGVTYDNVRRLSGRYLERIGDS